MKFEAALALMREGKKLRCEYYDRDGEYWICGFAEIPILEVERYKTIHRLNKEGKFLNDSNAWGIPRHLIMAEDWEIVE